MIMIDRSGQWFREYQHRQPKPGPKSSSQEGVTDVSVIDPAGSETFDFLNLFNNT